MAPGNQPKPGTIRPHQHPPSTAIPAKSRPQLDQEPRPHPVIPARAGIQCHPTSSSARCQRRIEANNCAPTSKSTSVDLNSANELTSMTLATPSSTGSTVKFQLCARGLATVFWFPKKPISLIASCSFHGLSPLDSNEVLPLALVIHPRGFNFSLVIGVSTPPKFTLNCSIGTAAFTTSPTPT